MTLDELDKKLAELASDIEAIRVRTEGLEASVTYRTAQATQLTGTTDTQVQLAFKRVGLIWFNRDKLQTLFDQAKAKRAKMPSVFRSAAIAEIEELLVGESILLEKRAANTTSDIFAGDRDHKATVDEVKKTIAADFKYADELMKELRKRLLDLGAKCTDYEQRITGLRTKVTEMGKPIPAELSDVEARLKSVLRKKGTDPLSITVADVQASLETYVKKALIKVQNMERELESVANDVRTAHGRLEQLRTLRTSALELSKRCTNEIRNDDLVAVPGKSTALADALTALDQLISERKFVDASGKLLLWHREADKFEREINGTMTANRNLLERKRKLVERWAAAQRQATMNAEAGLDQDKPLARFAEKANEALTGKIDVVVGESMVHSYEIRMGEAIAAYASRTPKDKLSERLQKAIAQATAAGLDERPALTAFARKAQDALAGDDLDGAELWVGSYETKLGELIAKGAGTTDGAAAGTSATPPATAANPPMATPPTTAPTPKEILSTRLAAAKRDAEDAGFADKKSLTAYAGKATEALEADDLDTAESMISSYEVKLKELKADG